MYIEVSVATRGKLCSTAKTTIRIRNRTLKGLDEDQRLDRIELEARRAMGRMIDWGWSVVEKPEKE